MIDFLTNSSRFSLLFLTMESEPLAMVKFNINFNLISLLKKP